MTPESIAKIVAAAVAEALAAEGTGVEVEAPSKPSSTPRKSRAKGGAKGGSAKVKTYTWRPWACARFGIPTKVGETFEYASKRSNTTNTHKVTAVDKEGNVTSVRA